MHSKPITFFAPRLPFFFCLPVPTIHLSLPSETGWPTSSLAVTHTSLWSTIPPDPPSLPFPSLFLSLSFPFDITKREKGSDNGGEPGP